ncbi:MAG: xanthine dehydrogenase accessory protein XdhC [Oscillospiraceae bacterium]|nr:xanthine dehydrogenase accessory protein XdhC [Oscillospiraceae bacterium]
MRKLFIEMEKRFNNKEDLVLVTIVGSFGATPRGAGARMLVGESGRISGTIGGGTVEFRSVELAKEVLEKQTSAFKRYILHQNQVEDLGMICGGNVTLFFRFIKGNDNHMLNLCHTVLEQFSEKKTTWLITELTDSLDGAMGLYSEKLGLVGNIPDEATEKLSGQTCTFELTGKRFFAEQILSPGFVYIFGGGHVSQELVPVLSHLEFRCIVLDDRPEFSTKELFPDAVDVRMTVMSEIKEMSEITAEDYIIVLTRGHSFDQAVEEQALSTPASYIGVIGSKSKRGIVEKNLLEHGFSPEDIKRVTAPIGLLGIKAQTPAELAISIAGQLIAFRAGAGIII